MKLMLMRTKKTKSFTTGKLFVNGKYFCDTLEDADRGLADSDDITVIQGKKIYGETAIPFGNYKVKITYSPRFKKMMPEVLNVKGFSGIRIHSGNDADDTMGCILVGENKSEGKIYNSRKTYEHLIELLIGETDIDLEIK